MASTYSSLLRVELIGTGDQSGTWGSTTNSNLGTVLEDAIAGAATIDVTAGNVTLTNVDGAADQARCMILKVIGTPGVSRNVIAPSSSKIYVVLNNSDASIVLKGSATTGITIASGDKTIVAWNGSDFIEVAATPSGGVGDVIGPSSATDNAVVLFDGTTGKLIKNSTATLPSGTLVGTSDSQTLTNKTIDGASNTLSNVNLASQITGTLPVANGGTGATTLTGIIKGSGTSAFSAATAGTDYLAPPSGTALLKANSGGALANAAAGTDYVAPGGALGTPSSGTLSSCTVDGTSAVGYRNVPPVGTKTSGYTLQTSDVGKYVQISSGGSITIPDATFAEGDVVSLFNNTSSTATITCSITTAYLSGVDGDVASATLAARGIATVLFISSTVCVLSGNVQ